MKRVLMIEGTREGYAIDQIKSTVTIRELIELLEDFAMDSGDDTEVYLKNDNGYTYGGIGGYSRTFELEEVPGDDEDIDYEDEHDDEVELDDGIGF